MKKIKQLAAAAAALITVTSVTACDESNGVGTSNNPGNAPTASTASSTTSGVPSTMKEEDAKTISDIEVQEFNLENKTIKFLSSWPMNPANGKAVPVSLEMFQQKYGGEVVDIVCPWDARYDQLGAMVAAGDSPDFFSAADLDVFPKGAIYNMFEPLDKYIDFDSELWQPTKEINDLFMFKDNHYVAAVGSDAGVVMIYNKKTIENYNLADPQALLEEDNWTWDTCWEMMSKFCNVEDKRYAIDGWWFVNAFNATTGVPIIGMENGVIVNNLNDPKIELAQEYLLKMHMNEMPYPKWEYGWQINPSNIAGGKTLFYPCGIWALYEADLSHFGNMEDIAFVPMPRCPSADKYYLPTAIDAYSICKGAQNPEGVACWLYCQMVSRDDERAIEIGKNQLFEDYGWTEEMYDMLKKTQELTEQNPMIDFYAGVTPNLYDLLNNPTQETFNNGLSWTQTRESIYSAVQAEVDAANAMIPGAN